MIKQIDDAYYMQHKHDIPLTRYSRARRHSFPTHIHPKLVLLGQNQIFNGISVEKNQKESFQKPCKLVIWNSIVWLVLKTFKLRTTQEMLYAKDHTVQPSAIKVKTLIYTNYQNEV